VHNEWFGVFDDSFAKESHSAFFFVGVFKEEQILAYVEVNNTRKTFSDDYFSEL
jgi:hypothetical protein